MDVLACPGVHPHGRAQEADLAGLYSVKIGIGRSRLTGLMWDRGGRVNGDIYGFERRWLEDVLPAPAAE